MKNRSAFISYRYIYRWDLRKVCKCVQESERERVTQDKYGYSWAKKRKREKERGGYREEESNSSQPFLSSPMSRFSPGGLLGHPGLSPGLGGHPGHPHLPHHIKPEPGSHPYDRKHSDHGKDSSPGRTEFFRFRLMRRSNFIFRLFSVLINRMNYDSGILKLR